MKSQLFFSVIVSLITNFVVLGALNGLPRKTKNYIERIFHNHDNNISKQLERMRKEILEELRKVGE